LLIAGIDPQAAVVKWDGWVSALGSKINKVRLLNARPLSKQPIFLVIPSPESPCISDEGHPGELTASWGVMPDAQEEAVKWEKLSILQALEEKLSHLNRLWISGQHSGQRYPAAYFIGWAEKKNIEIPWLSHAREMEWLPVSIKRNEADALPVVLLDALSGASADSLLSDVPGKMPRTAMGKLAVKAAWMVEIETKRVATARQAMTCLQKWADDGAEPETLLESDKQNRAVIWATGKGKTNTFDIEACGKALETWKKSRA
jgi:hypothetical protein